MACLLGLATAATGAGAAPTIVLIGGVGSEAPGLHEYAAGVRLMATWLREAMPEARIRAFERGWPTDPAALTGASTVVLYFDGAERHPLLDPVRRRAFEAVMARGAGLVALHQASTVPADDADSTCLLLWLGAVRPGLFDRTTETVTVQPAAGSPLSRGLSAFELRDEFYPTLRFAKTGKLTPVLSATLHPQFRGGVGLLANTSENATIAWAYERETGRGRSFGFTGAHFVTAFEQPMLRRALLNAIVWTAGQDVPRAGMTSAFDVPTFHHDAQRSGWFSHEADLTPANIASSSFGLLWQSPKLAAFEGQDARLYASPLYLDRLTLTTGPLRGGTFAAVIAASSNGDVYAINTSQHGDIAPGRILWHTRLAEPCRLQPAPLDGVPTGILSTPVIDAAQGRLYVAACDPVQKWQAYALDLSSGAVLPAWPVRLDEARLNAVNRNAGPTPVVPTRRFDFRVQRGALNLSPDGTRLYLAFGETETGWLAAVDTVAAHVDSAFAAVAMPHRGSGGIWGAGGPAVDEDGHVFVVTGSGFDGYKDQPNDWTQSLLKLSDRPGEGLRLVGTYTPFNHCGTATADIDLGSGGAALLPGSSLLAIGGKQGNVYLLDRSMLPGRLDRRPPCNEDAASDASLLPPGPQPQFAGRRGPLNVFGPYSEQDAALDLARARSVPATFRNKDGTHLIVTGSSKAAPGSPISVAPSLARLAVETSPTPHLRVAQAEPELIFHNPGSPIVSSKPDGRDAIAWVLDENARRSAPLAGANAPAPVLYAVDAITLRQLWQSVPGELGTSGKYNEPIVVRGQVIVGTDRIQAFGLGGTRAKLRVAPDIGIRPEPVDDGRQVDGAAIYRQRCAACHDAPQGSIPPRAWIAKRGRAAITEALTRGAMQVQAAGLTRREIEAVAEYLQ